MNKMMEKKPSKHDKVTIKLDNKLALSKREVTFSLDIGGAKKEEGKKGESKEVEASALAQLFKW